MSPTIAHPRHIVAQKVCITFSRPKARSKERTAKARFFPS
jgi:hypothetical protein